MVFSSLRIGARVAGIGTRALMSRVQTEVRTLALAPFLTNVFVPESMLDVSALVSVAVTVNGQSLGSRQLKCESRLQELDRILRAHDNPFLFLCQVIGEGSPSLLSQTLT